jgi:hypothetical protein
MRYPWRPQHKPVARTIVRFNVKPQVLHFEKVLENCCGRFHTLAKHDFHGYRDHFSLGTLNNVCDPEPSGASQAPGAVKVINNTQALVKNNTQISKNNNS